MGSTSPGGSSGTGSSGGTGSTGGTGSKPNESSTPLAIEDAKPSPSSETQIEVAGKAPAQEETQIVESKPKKEPEKQEQIVQKEPEKPAPQAPKEPVKEEKKEEPKVQGPKPKPAKKEDALDRLLDTPGEGSGFTQAALSLIKMLTKKLRNDVGPKMAHQFSRVMNAIKGFLGPGGEQEPKAQVEKKPEPSEAQTKPNPEPSEAVVVRDPNQKEYKSPQNSNAQNEKAQNEKAQQEGVDPAQKAQQEARAEALNKLGLDQDASFKDAKKAFHKEALKHHPDKHSNASQEVQDAEAEKFKEFNEAFDILGRDEDTFNQNKEQYGTEPQPQTPGPQQQTPSQSQTPNAQQPSQTGQNQEMTRAKALDTLGVDQNASFSEVRQAYKQQAKENHPDKQNGKSDAEKAEATAKFQEVQDAFNKLGTTEESFYARHPDAEAREQYQQRQQQADQQQTPDPQQQSQTPTPTPDDTTAQQNQQQAAATAAAVVASENLQDFENKAVTDAVIDAEILQEEQEEAAQQEATQEANAPRPSTEGDKLSDEFANQNDPLYPQGDGVSVKTNLDDVSEDDQFRANPREKDLDSFKEAHDAVRDGDTLEPGEKLSDIADSARMGPETLDDATKQQDAHQESLDAKTAANNAPDMSGTTPELGGGGMGGGSGG